MTLNTLEPHTLPPSRGALDIAQGQHGASLGGEGGGGGEGEGMWEKEGRGRIDSGLVFPTQMGHTSKDTCSDTASSGHAGFVYETCMTGGLGVCPGWKLYYAQRQLLVVAFEMCFTLQTKFTFQLAF